MRVSVTVEMEGLGQSSRRYGLLSASAGRVACFVAPRVGCNKAAFTVKLFPNNCIDE